jgi:hypothetical protein
MLGPSDATLPTASYTALLSLQGEYTLLVALLLVTLAFPFWQVASYKYRCGLRVGLLRFVWFLL